MQGVFLTTDSSGDSSVLGSVFESIGQQGVHDFCRVFGHEVHFYLFFLDKMIVDAFVLCYVLIRLCDHFHEKADVSVPPFIVFDDRREHLGGYYLIDDREYGIALALYGLGLLLSAVQGMGIVLHGTGQS